MIARIQKSMKTKDQGFTLIELLVVMIIIGILAAIAIPVFTSQRKKAVDASIKSDIKSVATEIETQFVDTQLYPATAGVAGAGGTVATAAKTTSTNTINYKPITGGFCVSGFSANGTADAAGNSFWYNSTTGGLKSAASAAAAAGC